MAPVSQQLLSGSRVVPEIGLASLFLQLRKLGAFGFGVKDTSEVLLPAMPVLCT